VTRDAGIETAVRIMSERGVRRLPIVTEDGKVTGIVTADDITILLTGMLADLGAGIRDNVDASESR
jgi:predicted transcriptional regulator